MGTRQNCLNEEFLKSTHNLCFRAKIKKTVYPCNPQFHYIKVRYKGVYITWACYPDEKLENLQVNVIRYMQHVSNI